MPGNLYIVSTPIGNLSDITFRAIEILKYADIIACEDTRHTKKVLNHYNIKASTTSYHEHNEDSKSERLLKELLKGKNIALVTDAGTPCISDPGFKIVSHAIKNGVKVVTVPGASSVISSLTLSGLPTNSFSFYGFVPRTKKHIFSLIDNIKILKTTLIFFESPNRIIKTLNYFLDGLGNRNAAVCRELTKLHEEVIHGTLEEIIKKMEIKESIKGEICLLIEGFQENKRDELNDDLILVHNKLKSLKSLKISLKDAVKVVSQEINLPKKEIYQKALEIWGN
ncbi:MAG: 16S rRNA (cytidine(1402)-2'-O)-methyltransferase [Thermodesulfobacteriota bacterium]